MDTDNLLIICRNCGRKTLMHNMKPDGENMICNDCYRTVSGVKSAKSVVGNKPYEAPKAKAVKSTKAEKMVKYLCSGCKYKFSRKTTQEVHKCPYCGKEDIVIDDALGANKLIGDSMNRKFDW